MLLVVWDEAGPGRLKVIAWLQEPENQVKRSLAADSLKDIFAPLQRAHESFGARFPGPRGDRQPVHTVYGGAHLFCAETAMRLGEKALQSLDEYGPDFVAFARAIDLPGSQLMGGSLDAAALVKSIQANPEAARKENRQVWFASVLYQRVREKLLREPVEDFRIDFEDGFGNRPDDEEDRFAAAAAGELAAGMAAGSLPPFIGLRIKPFNKELRNRSVRTLDIFLTELLERTGGKLPQNFFVTLPKVTIPEESEALAAVCSRLEPALGLRANTLQVELMIETPQSIFDERGELNLLPLAAAAQGRCVGAHFGTYDYTAGRGITAAHQHMMHFACDFAKEAMQVAYAGTGIWLSDGATNILPVPVHHAGSSGPPLTSVQLEDNRKAVHQAWKLHFEHIRHSLVNGFYQGWDLHPAQLVTRYAAVYSFFLESLDAASERLRNFIDKAAQATLVGDVFDDAATGQGLLNYFLRAINCGAISAEEAQRLTGLTQDEFRGASFVKILDGRKK
jgi:citrate lyase beta subunit